MKCICENIRRNCRNGDKFGTTHYSCIGDTKTLWITFFEYIHQNHPDFSEEWRYYKDGKNWLLKVVRKSKTVFWTSVLKDAFRITFYFTDKVEEAINSADISD